MLSSACEAPKSSPGSQRTTEPASASKKSPAVAACAAANASASPPQRAYSPAFTASVSCTMLSGGFVSSATYGMTYRFPRRRTFRRLEIVGQRREVLEIEQRARRRIARACEHDPAAQPALRGVDRARRSVKHVHVARPERNCDVARGQHDVVHRTIARSSAGNATFARIAPTADANSNTAPSGVSVRVTGAARSWLPSPTRSAAASRPPTAATIQRFRWPRRASKVTFAYVASSPRRSASRTSFSTPSATVVGTASRALVTFIARQLPPRSVRRSLAGRLHILGKKAQTCGIVPTTKRAPRYGTVHSAGTSGRGRDPVATRDDCTKGDAHGLSHRLRVRTRPHAP